MDAVGNLYGTTVGGGAYNAGIVFELSLIDGKWTETILHQFEEIDGKDGAVPVSGLIFDSSGNLYGTTFSGGATGNGTVFELMPEKNEGWKEKLIHQFKYNGKDGTAPSASLTIDGAGNLYGTTVYGGLYNDGTVFEVIPQVGGRWQEKVLHSFDNNGKDGTYPTCTPVMDASGNLYGTTTLGGVDDGGAVFELVAKGNGKWGEKVLHSFPFSSGGGPAAGLSLDAVGNLYGTAGTGLGVVFELMPRPRGGWTEKILHQFHGQDGTGPAAGLIFDGSGNLYSTTVSGGVYNDGTVFEVTP
jgi:uncharacterized repeat protein (TIGR03803 family)